jgi:hypothetical protein
MTMDADWLCHTYKDMAKSTTGKIFSVLTLYMKLSLRRYGRFPKAPRTSADVQGLWEIRPIRTFHKYGECTLIFRHRELDVPPKCQILLHSFETGVVDRVREVPGV